MDKAEKQPFLNMNQMVEQGIVVIIPSSPQKKGVDYEYREVPCE